MAANGGEPAAEPDNAEDAAQLVAGAYRAPWQGVNVIELPLIPAPQLEEASQLGGTHSHGAIVARIAEHYRALFTYPAIATLDGHPDMVRSELAVSNTTLDNGPLLGLADEDLLDIYHLLGEATTTSPTP